MIESKTNLLFLRLALLFSVLGSGITWTGLGYELASSYNNPSLMGLLQIISISASLAGPLLIACFPLKIRKKSILISSDFISAICYIALFFVISNPVLPFNSFVLMATLIFTSMAAGAIQAIYFEPLYASCIEAHNSKEKLSQEFARLGTYMTFGKLLGMGIGPVMFGKFHYYPLLFNASTFIVSACLFYIGLNGLNSNSYEHDDNIIKTNKKNDFNFNLLTNSTFLEGTIASTLIFIVVLFLSLKLIALEASALQMSLYWTSATLSALVSQMAISRSTILCNFLLKLDIKAGFLFALPVIAPLFFDNIWFIITCQIIFSFLNPIARNSARAHFYQTFGDNTNCNQTSTPYAMRDLMSQSILLIVGILLSFGTNFTLNVSLVTSLIFLRWFFANMRTSYADAR